MKFEKLLVNDKILTLCQRNVSPYKLYIKRYKQQKWTLKDCQANKFSKSSIAIRPQSSPNLFIRAFVSISCVIYTFF